MEKAYDVKELMNKLKGRGLNLGEDAAKGLLEDVLGWVEESAKLSATPYDDMGLIVLPKLKEMALAQIDKIDGVSGS
jgi:hypothetical protein